MYFNTVNPVRRGLVKLKSFSHFRYKERNAETNKECEDIHNTNREIWTQKERLFYEYLYETGSEISITEAFL